MADDSDVMDLVRQGAHEALARALADGADPDAVDGLGLPALADAAGRGDRAAVALLIEHGAALDKTSPEGNSALMLAAARGRAEVVSFLIEQGADPEAKNKWGFGPRDWATWSDKAGEVLAALEAPRA